MSNVSSDNTQSTSTELSLSQKEELILQNRTYAYRLCAHFLKKWGAHIETCELQSLSHMALCEAALRYRTDRGAQFQTVLFFYVRNMLIKEMKVRKNSHALIFIHSDIEQSKINEEIETKLSLYIPASSPDDQIMARELTASCQKALETLYPLEKQVVLEVFVHNKKIANVARGLGYSRGHISETRTKAVHKMRSYFISHKEAA